MGLLLLLLLLPAIVVCAFTVTERFAWLKSKGVFPSTVVDIGANVGRWTTATAKVWPDASYLMVEANREHEQSLRAVTRRLQKAQLAIALLGNATRQVPYFAASPKARRYHGQNTGNSIFLENRPGSSAAFSPRTEQMTSLDDLLASRGLGMPRVLKLDVQGAELLVLAGAAHTLAHVEVLLLEMAVVPYNVGAPLWFEVHAEVERLGFQAFDVNGLNYASGVLVQIDILFLSKSSRLWNATGYGAPAGGWPRHTCRKG